MANNESTWSSFTNDFADYELGQQIGFGASAIVYAAVFHPSLPTPPGVVVPSQGQDIRPSLSLSIPQPDNATVDSIPREKECAIKVSSSHSDTGLLFKEIRMLSMCRHPNVLRILATFTLPPDYRRIALVTPLVAGGSLAGILDWRSRLATSPQHHHLPRFGIRKKHDEEAEPPTGSLEEEEIKAVVKQVLEGLAYLHARGFIHRDLKAGNLLVEADGTILLADFGVGGDMNDPLTPVEQARPGVDHFQFKPNIAVTAPAIAKSSVLADESGKRKSFVGTPSWMAPEVVLQQRYDGRADIWSLGITMIELAHGAAPGGKNKANKILRDTILEPSPTLGKHSGNYSKSMRDFLALCLEKNPSNRPTAAQLLEHQWLKNAKKKAFLAEALLADIPPIEARQELRRLPSASSFVSRASSWDFTTTPSLPSSPTRSSLHIPMRSSSVLSQLNGYFPDNVARSQSRASTRISSVPPSPRVSLKQWAEMTAPEQPITDWRRSASERGSRRSSTPRRAQSASFDIEVTNRLDTTTNSRTRKRSNIEISGSAMSPLVEASLGTHVPSLLLAQSDISGPIDMSGLMIRDALSTTKSSSVDEEDSGQSSRPPAPSDASTPTSRRTPQTTPSTSPITPRRPAILTDAVSSATNLYNAAAIVSEKGPDRGRKGWLSRRGDERAAKEKGEHKWPALARRLTERMHRK